VHHEHHPIAIGQVVDRPRHFQFQVRFRFAACDGDFRQLVIGLLTTANALHLLESVQNHRGRDGVQPGAERRLPPEIRQLFERPYERVLREVASQRVVTSHPEGQPVDTVHVTVVERTLRARLAAQDCRHQLRIGHA